MRTKVKQNNGGYTVLTDNGTSWWGVGVTFPSEQAAQSVADAIQRAAATKPEPYVCTVLLKMPTDDGRNTRPEDVTNALDDMLVEVLEWHDEDLLEHGEEG